MKKQFSQKQKLAVLKKANDVGVREASKLAGVHYTTVYDWKKQLEALGEKEFLKYKPSKPGRGIKEIDPRKEKAVLRIFEDNPGYGPGQVKNQLRRQGITMSIESIRKIMSANGYTPKPRRKNQKECNRFEAQRPLELAQMDILEFFINKLKIYLILLLDDFSRFILGWRLLEKTSIDDVISLVQQSIDRYGKMQEILTDRGFVFYSWRGVNRFEKYLELNRIDHTHARPHHPQTLGKIEACNRRIKNELIDQYRFLSLKDANSSIESWVENYNYHRTHQGIGGLLVPADRFHGRVDNIMNSINKGIDITEEYRYSGTNVDRNIASLVIGNDGNLKLNFMGKTILLSGVNHDEKTQS
jgi:transposase InsO family protein